ncbi:protein TRC8 homolog [Melanaphis sacchari]|uniref:protein TRC8 homolog n=1 Tax=Melanaphis sacchari TaxID=742174 RepID=UPI000DC13D88|nr:protein TRC8 homolog [Melanaphis sacchari]
MKNEPLFVVVKYLLIRGCDTFTAVVGMTSFVSFFCYVIGDFFRTILMTSDDETMSIENLSATLFYILAVLTGLTLIEPEERFMGLYRIFFLIFGLLVSFIHNMASPLLLSMGISYNSSLHRHLRPLFVSGFLLMVSFFTLMYLWYSNLMSNWLIVVSSLNIQNIIQIFVTLNVYLLLIIDHSIPFEEKLDDYVFYIQSFGCAVTFCFGVVFFLHGIYNTIYIPDSLAHAPMIFLDTYLVVWCGIKKGWKIFIRRRLATLKIESLADATIDQTLLINNHCPICFQIMKSAKITNCNHYYHGRCLRKWLYIKDYCPMCHTIVSGHKNQTPTTD